MVVIERDAEAVDADLPVHGVFDGLEVGEEGDGALQPGQLGGRDGVESRVVQGGGEGVGGEASGEGLGLEGADAAAEVGGAGGGGGGVFVPGYEEGGVFCG